MQHGSGSQRMLFREEALQHYQQGYTHMVLPRFISPPTIKFLWCLVVLLLIAGTTAWFWHVPIYITASGEMNKVQGHTGALVVLVLPTNAEQKVHPGLTVLLQVGPNGPMWQQHITAVNATLFSPTEIRDRYHLDGALSLLVQQPSMVALIQLPATTTDYSGTIVQARIQIGTQRIISLLAG